MKRLILTNEERRAARHAQLSSCYGISISDFEYMLAAQSGRCANKGCEVRMAYDPDYTTTRTDHDHGTGQVRQILCPQCNTMLGKFRDDALALREKGNVLVGLADYLDKHQSKPKPKVQSSIPSSVHDIDVDKILKSSRLKSCMKLAKADKIVTMRDRGDDVGDIVRVLQVPKTQVVELLDLVRRERGNKEAEFKLKYPPVVGAELAKKIIRLLDAGYDSTQAIAEEIGMPEKTIERFVLGPVQVLMQRRDEGVEI